MRRFLEAASEVSKEYPVVISQFMTETNEIEFDGNVRVLFQQRYQLVEGCCTGFGKGCLVAIVEDVVDEYRGCDGSQRELEHVFLDVYKRQDRFPPFRFACSYACGRFHRPLSESPDGAGWLRCPHHGLGI